MLHEVSYNGHTSYVSDRFCRIDRKDCYVMVSATC